VRCTRWGYLSMYSIYSRVSSPARLLCWISAMLSVEINRRLMIAPFIRKLWTIASLQSSFSNLNPDSFIYLYHQSLGIMASFVSQLMSPGGGMMLIPFIRLVIVLLMLTTSTTFVFGVARIHMGILTVLSGGLLLSISFFENEYKKAASARNKNSTHINGSSSKTD